MYNRDKQKR